MPSESRVRSRVLRRKKKSASAARPMTRMRKPKASLAICARKSGIERVREGATKNRDASGMPESLYAVRGANANECEWCRVRGGGSAQGEVAGSDVGVEPVLAGAVLLEGA